MPTKRGADLAVSLERLAARAERDPSRRRPLGDLPTRRAGRAVPGRAGTGLPRHRGPAPPGRAAALARGRVADRTRRGPAPRPDLPPPAPPARPGRSTGTARRSSSPTRGPSPRRSRTTCARPAAWPRSRSPPTTRRSTPSRRREVEAALKAGELKAVVTSTSLELGVDIGSADLTVQVGLAGGRRAVLAAGRALGAPGGAASRGLLLAATPAELAGAVVTAGAARAGRVEPLRPIAAPLDVALPAVDRHGLRRRVVGRRRPSNWSARLAPMAGLARERLRRLPRLPGRRPGRARRGVRARAGRGAAMDRAPDLEARAGSSASATGA